MWYRKLNFNSTLIQGDCGAPMHLKASEKKTISVNYYSYLCLPLSPLSHPPPHTRAHAPSRSVSNGLPLHPSLRSPAPPSLSFSLSLSVSVSEPASQLTHTHAYTLITYSYSHSYTLIHTHTHLPRRRWKSGRLIYCTQWRRFCLVRPPGGRHKLHVLRSGRHSVHGDRCL